MTVEPDSTLLGDLDLAQVLEELRAERRALAERIERIDAIEVWLKEGLKLTGGTPPEARPARKKPSSRAPAPARKPRSTPRSQAPARGGKGKPRSSANADKLIAYLSEHGPTSLNDAIRGAGVPLGSAGATVEACERRGSVERRRDGRSVILSLREQPRRPTGNGSPTSDEQIMEDLEVMLGAPRSRFQLPEDIGEDTTEAKLLHELAEESRTSIELKRSLRIEAQLLNGLLAGLRRRGYVEHVSAGRYALGRSLRPEFTGNR